MRPPPDHVCFCSLSADGLARCEGVPDSRRKEIAMVMDTYSSTSRLVLAALTHKSTACRNCSTLACASYAIAGISVCRIRYQSSFLTRNISERSY
ncbi:hypothetical protein BDQ12DRAFT_680760 [Crucibulum laeve]|uniref:Uncharacterized protein n=1 Tax=Crucibulum laeve TaxID=68775 RepID=A0A5C3M6M2_9AGAR|nr:hypothetical protein BDQ12DRAFT_680760 [Crucibulum laeve]